MSNYETFLSDLKALCDKHRIYIKNPYDEPINLVDTEGERIAEYVDFDNFKAYPYEKKEFTPTKVVPLTEADILLKDLYGRMILEDLNTESPLLKLIGKI